MAQYVLQVKNDTQQLIKSYEVTEESPIRDITGVHNMNRKQIVITDKTLFDSVVEVYKTNKLNAKFTLDEATNGVSWTIEG